MFVRDGKITICFSNLFNEVQPWMFKEKPGSLLPVRSHAISAGVTGEGCEKWRVMLGNISV